MGNKVLIKGLGVINILDTNEWTYYLLGKEILIKTCHIK